MAERYNRVAELYDMIGMDKVNDFVPKIVSYFRNKGFNPKKVLDIACGTGTATTKFAEHGYNIRGTDISEGVLEVARKKAKQKGLDIEFKKEDMTSFSLEEKVDLIIASGSPLYMGNFNAEQVDKTLNCVYNSLSKEGYFAFDIINFDQFRDYLTKNMKGLPMISQKTYPYKGKDYKYIINFEDKDTAIITIKSEDGTDTLFREVYKKTDLEELLQKLNDLNFTDIHFETVKNGFQEDYLIFAKKA